MDKVRVPHNSGLIGLGKGRTTGHCSDGEDHATTRNRAVWAHVVTFLIYIRELLVLISVGTPIMLIAWFSSVLPSEFRDSTLSQVMASLFQIFSFTFHCRPVIPRHIF
jgi:hypothetical protein